MQLQTFRRLAPGEKSAGGGEMVLLDSDSFQIACRDRRFHCPVSRPPYTAPELIGTDFARTWREPCASSCRLKSSCCRHSRPQL